MHTQAPLTWTRIRTRKTKPMGGQAPVPPTYQEAGVLSDAKLGTELGVHGNENMARRSMERASMSNDTVPLLTQSGVNTSAPVDKRRGSL